MDKYSGGLIEEQSNDGANDNFGQPHSLREQTQIRVGPNDLRQSAEAMTQHRSTSSDLILSKGGK